MLKLYMNFRVVNDKNALDFDKANTDEQIVFAKYFSPSCPACIAMEDEWNNMCKEIDNKYNTDLILASVDPSGMDKLKNTKTYHDVEYVPTIVILKNGKKIQEYDRSKRKDDMINFLLEHGFLKLKMKGGNNSSMRLESNTQEHYKTFYKQQVDIGTTPRYKMTENAINMVESTLRKNSLIQSNTSYSSDNNLWTECIKSSLIKNYTSDLCRISIGLNNLYIPRSLKYNPSTTFKEKQQALNAYEFLLIYEAMRYCKNSISNYLYSVVSDKKVIPDIIIRINNEVYEYDYLYDETKQSYPSVDFIFKLIAETTVNTVKELDTHSQVSDSDSTILINSFKNINLTGGMKDRNYRSSNKSKRISKSKSKSKSKTKRISKSKSKSKRISKSKSKRISKLKSKRIPISKSKSK